MAQVDIVSNRALEIVARLNAAVMGACLDTGEAIRDEAQSSIRSGAKHGRTYHRDGKTYTASAPGEPPANVEGDLADSIVAHPAEDGAEVVATDRMAETMEHGSPGGLIAPRPFLTPAAEGQRDQNVGRITRAIQKVAGG